MSKVAGSYKQIQLKGLCPFCGAYRVGTWQEACHNEYVHRCVACNKAFTSRPDCLPMLEPAVEDKSAEIRKLRARIEELTRMLDQLGGDD